jgi:hypothetical protein
MTAFVTPKARKHATDSVILMGQESECMIEQNKGDRVFLRSLNGKNFFWVNLFNDSDWSIEL